MTKVGSALKDHPDSYNSDGSPTWMYSSPGVSRMGNAYENVRNNPGAMADILTGGTGNGFGLPGDPTSSGSGGGSGGGVHGPTGGNISGPINQYSPVAQHGNNQFPQFNFTPPPVLSFNEAQQRAINMLKPQFEQSRKDMLGNSMIRNDARGLAFSPLGEQIDQDVEGRLTNQYNTNLANIAQQLVGQSEEQAQRALQNAMQQYGLQLQAFQAQHGANMDHMRFNHSVGQDQFANMMMMKQFGLEEHKVNMAQNDQVFNQWLAQQGLTLDWARLDESTKSRIVDQYLTMRGQDLNIQNSREDRDWRTGENTLDRNFQAGQNAANRNFQAGQNAANRNHQTSQNNARMDFEREMAQMKNSGSNDVAIQSTINWMGFLGEAINTGHVKSMEDVMRSIAMNRQLIEKEGVDIQRLLMYAVEALDAK